MSKWVGLWVVVALGVQLGCSSSDGLTNGNIEQPKPVGSMGGSSQGTPLQCFEGSPCSCDTGQNGTITCQGDQATCDCSACAASTRPVEPVAFDACGGEPFGAWRLVSAKLPSVLFRGNRLAQVVWCQAGVTSEKAPLHMMLELKDGGDANVYAGDGLVEGKFPESCLQPIQESCEENGYTRDACNNCVGTGSPLSLDPNGASWTRSGSQLSLTTFQAELATFDYCVKGDQLSLFLNETQSLLALERVSLGGKPSLCAERSAESCVQKSIHAFDACHVGSCSGTGKDCAAATTEASCTNQQGCSWDKDACAGTPGNECTIGDYGLLPGCNATTKPLVCTGTAKACADYTPEKCPTAAGCVKGNECTGTSKACSGFWDHCTPGCACTAVPNGDYCDCTGTSDCSKAITEEACHADTYECAWTPACQGKLPDCSTVDPEMCAQIPGCYLDASP